jgi:hypothetical protein
MKPLKTIATGVVIILTLCFATLINRSAASKPHNATIRGDGFVVLELFTSEGCSSCPPADELLARIQQEAGNTPVYVLAYHVDYWNRLGWKDIFSKPEFSKRQYQYSRQLGAQVYTPQLIVNGKAEFVGSDEAAITSAVKTALESKSSIALTVQAGLKGAKININYQTKGNTAAHQLLLALVQKHAVSKVANGENGGRTLHHVQIVRNLYTFDIEPGQQGAKQIEIPDGFNTNEWEIIGLLQDQQTGAIEGAARAAIGGSVSR